VAGGFICRRSGLDPSRRPAR